MTKDEILNWANSNELYDIRKQSDGFSIFYRNQIFLIVHGFLADTYNLLYDEKVIMVSYVEHRTIIEDTTLYHLNYSLDYYKRQYDFLILYHKKQFTNSRKMELSKDFGKC